jgi:hypothetical protein
VNLRERWSIHFPDRKQGLRVIQTTFHTVRVGIPTNFKRLVIDPAAFLKLALKDAPLAVRKVDAIFKSFSLKYIITLA